MTYTDEQLKRTLAKMLPEKVTITHTLLWCKDIPENPHSTCREVLDTELLHLCWLVEKELFEWADRDDTGQDVVNEYLEILATLSDCRRVISSWQQRTIALAETKGIEICQ